MEHDTHIEQVFKTGGKLKEQNKWYVYCGGKAADVECARLSRCYPRQVCTEAETQGEPQDETLGLAGKGKCPASTRNMKLSILQSTYEAMRARNRQGTRSFHRKERQADTVLVQGSCHGLLQVPDENY